MRFNFGEKETRLELLQSTVAIRSASLAPSASATPSASVAPSSAPRRNTALARSRRDAEAAAATGIGPSTISSTARRLFTRAGIVLAESDSRLTEAALYPASSAEGILPVFYDSVRNTLVGTGMVTVQLPADMSPAQARDRMEQDGLVVVEELGFGVNLYVARPAEEKPFEESVDELQEHAGYLFVEPVFLQVLKGRQAGGDPDLVKQWHHENAGSAVLKKGCDIRTPAAWQTTRGKGVRIAVIDNGMQIDHPDLQDGIVLAASFATDKATGATTFSQYPAGATFPDTNHGTFCLGMAGARRNNGVGGCGSAPEADLMAIACAPDQVDTQVTLAKAVAFAADPRTEKSSTYRGKGADILSCSLGAENGAWTMQSILDQALTEAAAKGRGGLGLPIFWAVSNARVAIDRDQVCSHPDVIAIGRSGYRDVRGVCAFGPKLDFLAPGEDVFSTQSGGTFGTDSGTSYACPLAAGVAALVVSEYPRWTRDEVRDRLRASCEKIGGPMVEYDADGRNDDYGFGRINAERAV